MVVFPDKESIFMVSADNELTSPVKLNIKSPDMSEISTSTSELLNVFKVPLS